MPKGSCSPPGPRSPTGCSSSANATRAAPLPSTRAHHSGRRPHRSLRLRPPRPGHPAADLTQKRDQAPRRSRRPHQRIRADRVDAQVMPRGRVLEPHRLAGNSAGQSRGWDFSARTMLGPNRLLSLHSLGEGRRVTNTALRPSRINASGSGHHQCSQSAARPWSLSRPTQNTPRSRKTPPTTWPIRRIVERLSSRGGRTNGSRQHLLGSRSYRNPYGAQGLKPTPLRPRVVLAGYTRTL